MKARFIQMQERRLARGGNGRLCSPILQHRGAQQLGKALIETHPQIPLARVLQQQPGDSHLPKTKHGKHFCHIQHGRLLPEFKDARFKLADRVIPVPRGYWQRVLRSMSLAPALN